MLRSGNKVLNTDGVCRLAYSKCRNYYGFSVRQLFHVVSTYKFTFVWTCLSITIINNIMYRHLSSVGMKHTSIFSFISASSAVLRHSYVNT